MAGTVQPSGGDCDSDGTVEPIPFRDPGAGPRPTGGGYLPTSIGAQTLDPWQMEYGYCVWDHGSQRNATGCGGATQRRLTGAPAGAGTVIGVISAGRDRTFQTTCNAFVDANADGQADTPLLNRAGGSDDIINAYTYAEAMGVGDGIWRIKTGEPTTAEVTKDIEVDGDAEFSGVMRLGGGLVLPGDPGDNTITGGCNTANDQVMRRNTSTSPPTIEICDFAGGQTIWTPTAAGGGGGGVQGGVDAIAASGGSCSKVGELRRDASGRVLVCEPSSNTVHNQSCAGFSPAALTLNSRGALHVCAN